MKLIIQIYLCLCINISSKNYVKIHLIYLIILFQKYFVLLIANKIAE